MLGVKQIKLYEKYLKILLPEDNETAGVRYLKIEMKHLAKTEVKIFVSILD